MPQFFIRLFMITCLITTAFNPDSVLAQVGSSKSTSSYCNESLRYSKMASDTIKVNVQKAKGYSIKSFLAAEKCENDSLLLRSTRFLGIVYKILENTDSSIYYSKLGVKYAERVSDLRTASALTTVVARAYADVGEYNEAYDYFNKAEVYYETLNKDSIDPTFFFFKLNKAALFNELTLYDVMFSELFEAKRIADSVSDDYFMGQILGSIAVGYKQNNQLKKSIEYNKKAVAYFEKNESDLAITYTNIGNSFSELNMLDSAMYYYQQAREIYNGVNAGSASLNKVNLAQAQMYLKHDRIQETTELLGKIDYSTLGNDQKAEVFLLKSKVTSDPIVKREYAKQALESAILSSDILLQKESYFLLYEYHKGAREFNEALTNFEHYQTFEDSIFNREKSKAIQKVLLQKTIDEKNLEIELNELQFERDKAEKDKTILFAVLALVTIVLILGVVYFRYRSQKQKTRIEVQSKELLEKENMSIKNELVQALFESDRNFDMMKGAREKLNKIKKSEDKQVELNSLSALINSYVISETEKRNYQERVNEIKEDFFQKIGQGVKLTRTEKKMATLLKLDLSTKEIASVLNVADSTVEVYRSRLRKKLRITKEQSLTDYFNNLKIS